jgi:predicted transcriptional regulator
MKPFCEYMIKEIFPCLRAMVAQDLVENYNISQSKAAELMGISQPAISQYMRSLRGKKKEMLEHEDVKTMVREMADGLHSNTLSKDDLSQSFCNVCDILSKTQATIS